MSEILQIAEAVEALGAKRAAIATVVETHGSTYRKAGARTLLDESGASVGAITGGCLSRDLERRMQMVMKSGTAELIDYDTQADADAVWGSGAGCGGVMETFIQPVTEDVRNWLAAVKTSGETREIALTAIVLRSDLPWRLGRGEIVGRGALCPDCGAVPGANETPASLHRCAIGEWRFFERHDPPLSLTICGAGTDSRPLAELGAALGWQVTVCDWREHLLDASRFPSATALVRYSSRADLEGRYDDRCAVVLAAHDFMRDLEFLEFFASRHVGYIGMLGPKRRGDSIISSLGSGERTPELLDRLFWPAGLDIGSESPAEIALSITSEIQAQICGGEGHSLKSKHASIHTRRQGHGVASAS